MMTSHQRLPAFHQSSKFHRLLNCLSKTTISAPKIETNFIFLSFRSCFVLLHICVLRPRNLFHMHTPKVLLYKKQMEKKGKNRHTRDDSPVCLENISQSQITLEIFISKTQVQVKMRNTRYIGFK